MAPKRAPSASRNRRERIHQHDRDQQRHVPGRDQPPIRAPSGRRSATARRRSPASRSPCSRGSSCGCRSRSSARNGEPRADQPGEPERLERSVGAAESRAGGAGPTAATPPAANSSAGQRRRSRIGGLIIPRKWAAGWIVEEPGAGRGRVDVQVQDRLAGRSATATGRRRSPAARAGWSGCAA